MQTTQPRAATHGVLFDVGSCLMDESGRAAAAFAWLSRELHGAGHPGLTPADLAAAYRRACTAPGPGRGGLLVQMCQDLGVPAEVALALRGRLVWDAVPLPAFPETGPALRRLLGAGLRLGVLANQPASAADDLRRAGLWDCFDGVWLSEAVGLHKPDPAFFRKALSAWGLPPEQVAYVGDRPDHDVAPAKALGLFTVRVRTGPHRDQPAAAANQQADVDVETLIQAADALVQWAARSPAA